jgi:hypothetical protein
VTSRAAGAHAAFATPPAAGVMVSVEEVAEGGPAPLLTSRKVEKSTGAEREREASSSQA